MTDRSFKRRFTRELSIMDLALALLAVLVVSCIAIPFFYAQPRVTLDNAAVLFARDLRYAQNEAAMSGQDTQLELSADGDGYSVSYVNGGAVGNPVGGADLTRVYSHDAIFRGVQIQLLEGSGSPSFDRYGFSLSGGSYELMYAGDHRVVHLKRGNGHVEIEGLKSEWVDSEM